MRRKWAIAIHGGAGVIERTLPTESAAIRVQRLEDIIASVSEALASGKSALDAVEEAVIQLEESPEFNAGKGAVFTANGSHELEAAIMNGHTGDCGAVCLVDSIRNPIRLARRILEQSPHVLLTAQAAQKLADDLERVPNDWFDTDLRKSQWEQWKARAD
ncbi:MAG: isoaspartyl peptidase/L-asparaginase, partial [Phycisphaerales bacterium]|nr:isoaspartyl peptidase/L-asparaginase [Phycisphaerales bacterium]